MKKVIEYKLDGDGSVPVFVSDGGYFLKEHKLVGLSVDSTDRFMPSSVVILTNQDLIDRVVSITMNTIDGEVITTAEKTTIATNWLQERDLV